MSRPKIILLERTFPPDISVEDAAREALDEGRAMHERIRRGDTGPEHDQTVERLVQHAGELDHKAQG